VFPGYPCGQISGVRFLYDNIIESPTQYEQAKGFGCVLAHSMGLGKTMQVRRHELPFTNVARSQVITFTDVLLRSTSAAHVLVVVPKNVLTNWQVEFDRWLPPQVSGCARPLVAPLRVCSRRCWTRARTVPSAC